MELLMKKNVEVCEAFVYTPALLYFYTPFNVQYSMFNVQ